MENCNSIQSKKKGKSPVPAPEVRLIPKRKHSPQPHASGDIEHLHGRPILLAAGVVALADQLGHFIGVMTVVGTELLLVCHGAVARRVSALFWGRIRHGGTSAVS